MTNKAGLDRLDFAEARGVGELVEVKIDKFLELSSGLSDDYEELHKEAYVLLLYEGILKINDNEDPRKRINSSKITPEVVSWFKKAALALEEEEALREKCSKALDGEKVTEH